ncbi:MAG: RluA family pseudouridine synthase [Proteobacteria bacterium]|nr:RluA family pseudouridine synthase [Pseudomonadota bacterium]
MPYVESALEQQDSAPIRPGVQRLEVTEEEAGQRLDNYLHKRLGGLPRSRIFRIIRKGEVRVNGKRASPETRLALADTVRVPPVSLAAPEASPRRPSGALSERIAQSIIFEDARLLVIDKPAGVAVHGGSGVSFGVIEALRALRPEETLELVHRLDRDTSGCLLIAKRSSTLRTLHALLREETGFEKRYLALVRGAWDLGDKRIDAPLRTDTRVGGERTVKVAENGKPSVSRFRPVQFFGRFATLLEVELETGRTHQIRVHAAHAGHPVAGDEKYGDPAFSESLRALGLHRMFLHAHSISFKWPEGGEFSINTPLPAELGALIDRLATQRRPGPQAAERPRPAAAPPARGAQAAAKAPGSRRRAARPRAR